MSYIEPHDAIITTEQREQAIAQIGTLLKERLSLQQSLANQSANNTSSNEQLFLELLEIFDTLESLIDYFNNNTQPTERAIDRLPKTLSTIQSKLLATLARQQVQIVEINDTDPQWQLYQVVDTQIDPTATTQKVSKVVRQGFTINNRLLRPVEVIVSRASE